MQFFGEIFTLYTKCGKIDTLPQIYSNPIKIDSFPHFSEIPHEIQLPQNVINTEPSKIDTLGRLYGLAIRIDTFQNGHKHTNEAHRSQFTVRLIAF